MMPLIFGWRAESPGAKRIPVRFDPEFMKTLKTMTYSSYARSVAQQRELVGNDRTASIEFLAQKYPFIKEVGDRA